MNLNLTLWHDIMYCVGVFVTCNIGGAALCVAIDGASTLMKRHAATESASGDGNKRHPFDNCSFDDMNRYSEEEPVHVEAEPVSTPHGGQSFEEMQRQIRGERESVTDKTE